MLYWKLEGDEIWGYEKLDDPFTAYAVKKTNWTATPSYESWSQRGAQPRLLGTHPGPQAAMRACEEDFKKERT